ncbi:MAG: response regulator [Balneolaceae bacterium]
MMNILIVEDDKVIALMLQRMVEKLGYHVTAVTESGRRAVELANNRRFDLILMDIMLEDDLDGISAYRIISQSLAIPVIYITGNSDDANRNRAAEVGYFDYMIKPISFDALQDVLQRLYEKISSNQ